MLLFLADLGTSSGLFRENERHWLNTSAKSKARILYERNLN